jgi:hypothetical protein
MLPIAELSNGQVRGRSSQFSRRAVLISPANEEDLVAKLPSKPGMNIRGKERTDKVAMVGKIKDDIPWICSALLGAIAFLDHPRRYLAQGCRLGRGNARSIRMNPSRMNLLDPARR